MISLGLYRDEVNGAAMADGGGRVAHGAAQRAEVECGGRTSVEVGGRIGY